MKSRTPHHMTRDHTTCLWMLMDIHGSYYIYIYYSTMDFENPLLNNYLIFNKKNKVAGDHKADNRR